MMKQMRDYYWFRGCVFGFVVGALLTAIAATALLLP